MIKIVKLSSMGLLLLAVLTLLALRTFGLEPQDQRPGLWLAGELVEGPVTDWSFSNNYHEIFVQTNTRYGIPYSVTTYCTVYEGRLYLFSAYYQGGPFPETRGWNVNVMRDPRVRLKIGDRLFDQQLRYISDESIRNGVIRSFENKYPEWGNPGDENVHVLLVE